MVLAVSRIVSLASVLAVAAFPVFLVFLAEAPTGIAVAGAIVAMIIVLRHRPNLQRLVAGTEPRFGGRRGGDDR